MINDPANSNVSPGRRARRRFLKGIAGAGLLAGCRREPEPQIAHGVSPNLGAPISEYGQPSRFEKLSRFMAPSRTPQAGANRTPLGQTYGMLTPASLHFERHHAGVPLINPAEHKLLIHGMVDRPLVFTVDDIRRLPSVSEVYFIECAGNGRSEWSNETAPDAARSHGLAACSEWTGVPLRALLEEAGIASGASWVLAEGADACKMQRSIPLVKALDDILVAYGQNGEPIRPEQGYPLRLVIPGWEGNTQVKWLRRLKVSDAPWMVRDETSKYTDLLADGKARQFSFVMEVKSVITRPSGGQTIPSPGPFEIDGLAWSGRGKIAKVEVSTDGGQSWKEARLQDPVLPRAFTRFRLPWQWDGQPVTLLSRATDETGYVQPTLQQLIAERGRNSDYHNNCIKAWRVTGEGKVTNV